MGKTKFRKRSYGGTSPSQPPPRPPLPPLPRWQTTPPSLELRLFNAAQNGEVEEVRTILEEMNGQVDELINWRNPNARNEGNTALMDAAQYNHPE